MLFRTLTVSLLSLIVGAGCAGGSGSAIPSGSAGPASQPFSSTQIPGNDASISGARNTLYVAMPDTDTLAAYKLPLYAGEQPTVTTNNYGGVPDGAVWGLAAHGNNLFAAFSRSNSVGEYQIPFTQNEPPKAILNSPGTYDVAASSSFLYANDVLNGLVSAYKLPLSTWERPTAVLSGFKQVHSLLIVGSDLYVADAVAGTVDVYALPLTTGEVPTLRINAGSPYGLAANPDADHLFVEQSNAQQIYVYTLPYVPGETPRIANLYFGTIYIAVGLNNLYGSFANVLSDYALPLKSEQPKIMLTPVPYNQSLSGVAIGR